MPKDNLSYFEVLMDSSGDGYWDFDFSTGIVTLSPKWLETLGYSKDDFFPNIRWLYARLHPDEINLFKSFVTNHGEGDDFFYELKHRLLKKDGTYAWVHRRGKVIERLPDGNVARMVGSIRDISTEEETKLKLIEKEKMLREAQRVAKIGSWEFSFLSMKISWTEQMFYLFGNDPALNEPSFDEHYHSIHPDDRTYWKSVVDKASADGEPYLMEFRVAHPGNQIVWVMANGEGIFQGGQMIGLRGTCQDITQKKILEKSLDAEKLRLAHIHKQTSLGHLSTNLAHEVNNPLTIISGYLQMIKLKSNPDDLSPIIGIESSVKRIQEIVKVLNTFSGQKGNLEPSLVSIKEAVINAATMFDHKFKKHEINFSLEVSSDLHIYGRINEIMNVFFNLLTNAFDAVKSQQGPWLTVKSWDDDAHVYVRFIDSGTGIPQNILDQLFDPFFTTKREGLGLGLAITKNLMDGMDAAVSYELHQGKTSFLLTFKSPYKL